MLRPLVVPGVATTVLYAFLLSWTEFVGALTFITSNNLYTLPLALLNMECGSVGQVNFGCLEAGAVIAMVPCVLLYIGLQRFYIRGLVCRRSLVDLTSYSAVRRCHPRVRSSGLCALHEDWRRRTLRWLFLRYAVP